MISIKSGFYDENLTKLKKINKKFKLEKKFKIFLAFNFQIVVNGR
jgi:hypothetical protein